MRDINDYFAHLGVLPSFEGTGSSQREAHCYHTAKLIGIVVHSDVLLDADHTFDVIVNGADTGIDVTIPDETPADSGVFMPIAPGIDMNAGDTVYVTSNGEQTVAGDANFTAIFRKLVSSRPVNDYAPYMGRIAALQTAHSLSEMAALVVHQGEVRGLMYHNKVAIDAITTLRLLRNGVNMDGTTSVLASSIASGLEGYWPANNDGLDASVNSNNVVLANNAGYSTAGWAGTHAFDFPGGADDEGEAAISAGIPIADTDRSLACWVYSDDFNVTNQMLFGYGTATAALMSALVISGTAGMAKFWGHGLDVESTVPLASGQWNHLAFTKAGAVGKLYQNGVLVATGDVDGLNTSAGTSIMFGNFTSVVDEFTGKIDEAALWDRALTAAEVLSLAADTNRFKLPVSGLDAGGVLLPETTRGQVLPITVYPGDLLTLKTGGEQVASGIGEFSPIVRRSITRSWKEYTHPAGSLTAVQTADNQPTVIVGVAAEPGRVVSFHIDPSVAIDAETTFDILINDVDSGVDVTLPDASPANVATEMVVPNTVEVAIGDSIKLRSNGEQIAACTADLWVTIRR